MKTWKQVLLITFLLAIVPALFFGAGTYSRVKTWNTGETLTASDLNAEFDNILNNSDPDGIGDASANATAMQATADPYPSASVSLATDLTGELKRLRYIVKQLSGEAYWYVDPELNLQPIMQRSTFVSTSDTVLTIGAGRYFHSGTSKQVVYWNESLAFTLGSGGSNSDSDDMDASKWHYIYIDDSAVVTQGAALLDADCFVNYSAADSDNVPAWSNTKHGWYGTGASDAATTDRCIFAIYSDSDSDQLEFIHSGDFVAWLILKHHWGKGI